MGESRVSEGVRQQLYLYEITTLKTIILYANQKLSFKNKTGNGGASL